MLIGNEINMVCDFAEIILRKTVMTCAFKNQKSNLVERHHVKKVLMDNRYLFSFTRKTLPIS